ncbi:unnamed protein product, partial [Closterium sp. NIES-53]
MEWNPAMEKLAGLIGVRRPLLPVSFPYLCSSAPPLPQPHQSSGTAGVEPRNGEAGGAGRCSSPSAPCLISLPLLLRTPTPSSTPEFGYCTEWNPAMEKLAGLKREEVMGKMLTGDVFGALCRLKSSDSMTKLMIILNNAMDGNDTERFPFSFLDRQGKLVEVLLTAQKRTDAEGAITGVFCFLHTASPELQQALTVQKAAEKVAEAKAKELAYIRQEIKNPLDGIMFARSFIEHTELTEDQKQLVETSAMCEKQLRRILDDMDLASIEEGYLELDTAEFMMATVMNSVVSQGMISSSRKGLQLFCDTPPEFKTMNVFGDQVRLQQVLADFLLNAVQFTPASGWVEVKVVPSPTKLPGGVTVVKLEF